MASGHLLFSTLEMQGEIINKKAQKRKKKESDETEGIHIRKTYGHPDGGRKGREGGREGGREKQGQTV